MTYIADLHLHSKYSRATSSQMDVDGIFNWAKIKGINLISTGDYTHPEYLRELKQKLEIDSASGFYHIKNIPHDSSLITHPSPVFIPTAEISCIYSKNNNVRRLHIVLITPTLEECEKINTQLSRIGNLKSDGRPILGLDAKELAKIVLEISPDSLVIPAHCLKPESLVHTKKGIKQIKDMKIGDKVFTHKGKWQKVSKVLNRNYHGLLYNIRPYYFRIGLETTPEHPFYVIKSYKNCSWIKGLCRPQCSQANFCKKKYFQKYQPQWILAKDIRKNDIIVYPRFKQVVRKNQIRLSQYISKREFLKLNNNSRSKVISDVLKIDKNFCRLVGYYLAEGYTNSRDCISFSFSRDEKDNINDIKGLMSKLFKLIPKEVVGDSKGIELVFYSKVLQKFFSRLFYAELPHKAQNKKVPFWMIELPKELQVEILKGWWRGDSGYTSSRYLMNAFKIIMLRLGIIPSIRIDSKLNHFQRGNHNFQKRLIKAQHDSFQFSNLSFFEDSFGLLQEKEFKKFKTKIKRRHGWINNDYIYLPIRDIERKSYDSEVYNLEVENDNSYTTEFALVHNCWTPWFAIFGSKSGFDSIEECFEELTPKIYAIETGLSSDPPMNWRLSALDNITLISNSDAHSPANLGREVNIFELEQLTYQNLTKAIRREEVKISESSEKSIFPRSSEDEKNKDAASVVPPLPRGGREGGVKEDRAKNYLAYTVEFFPQEGKYHYDGHSKCHVCFSPDETKKNKGICPQCKKPLTLGVDYRVSELADRPVGSPKPQGQSDYKSLVPLQEIIADSIGQGKNTKAVQTEYENMIKKGKNEFNILLNLTEAELKTITTPKITEGIKRVRAGNLIIQPGFDGQYGIVKIFSKQEQADKQKTLF